MTKVIDGRKAEITNSLQVYTNWVTLAAEHGYPKAAYVYGSDKRSHLNDGDTVTLLTSTFVHDGAMIWVVQARNGEQFLYSEKGLRILPDEAIVGITLLPDESLGGISREYREVKRTANVGELVKITDNNCGHHFPSGEIVRIRSVNTAEYLDKRDWWAVKEVDYVVLEPTDILRIDDKDGVNRAYRMVDRKAAVGERVIVTEDRAYFRAGQTFVVERTDYGIPAVGLDGRGNVLEAYYRVLEPLTSAELAPTPTPLSALPIADQYAENITVLTRKIAQLEGDLRVAREDIVLIEEGVSGEIKALEKRTLTLEKRILALETDSSPSYVKVAEGPVDTTLPSYVKKSAQKIRDGIVERAKADVERIIDECWAAVRVG
ncbi:hypothetical protein MKX34_23980 [Paenibacillus sp. FSL R5-0636]|uniref:hypothetical protein n=1 Tax=Paenibacillus TaxID=44249 RepID=UPI00096D8456|nr:hypothetical protein [Paenibacillus odorifer]OMC96227.1 hypothetical protein BJP49_11030 [Paenibacillus odorifer]